ncbi:hypothetical protein [Paenibacillus periandrae]|nr:hypothetical protein [Paenibacillus periandrae]
MNQQLTLDTFLNTTSPINGVIDSYLMLDFLDRLKGDTAFMRK